MRMSEPADAPPEIRPLSSDSGHRVRRQVEAENDEEAEEDLTDDGELDIQRQCATCEGEEDGDETIQRQAKDRLGGTESDDEEDDTVVQTKRRSSAGSAAIAASTGSRVASLRGQGDPLASSLREHFEPRFGRDFSSVRARTGTTADETARALGARAYTFNPTLPSATAPTHRIRTTAAGCWRTSSRTSSSRQPDGKHPAFRWTAASGGSPPAVGKSHFHSRSSSTPS